MAEKASAALKTMKKILENITNNPDEEKYRKLRMSNAAIQEKILGVPGATECLQIAGFSENDGHLVVAAKADREVLEMTLQQMAAAVEEDTRSSEFVAVLVGHGKCSQSRKECPRSGLPLPDGIGTHGGTSGCEWCENRFIRELSEIKEAMEGCHIRVLDALSGPKLPQLELAIQRLIKTARPNSKRGR